MKSEKLIWIATAVALAITGVLVGSTPMGWTLLVVGILTLLVTAAS